jgi:urea transport system permease protein
VNYAKTWFTAAYPELWLFALGALFIVVTVFMPRGLLGVADGVWQRLRGAFGGGARAARQPAE